MVLIFALNGKPASPKRGKGKAANRPFTHPDRQSPQHAPQNAKKAAGFLLPPLSVDDFILLLFQAAVIVHPSGLRVYKVWQG